MLTGNLRWKMTSKKKTKVSSVIIFNLSKTNAVLADLVKRQQTELEYQSFRIQGFLDYLKNHCKEKKSRMTPTKSYKALRKDLN